MATRTLYHHLFCLCLIVFVCHEAGGHRGPRHCKRFIKTRLLRRCNTCNPFKPKEVTLVVRNVLKDPTFEESVTLSCTRSKTLFYMMQEAADDNIVFRFTVTYFGSELGFFIEAINGVAGTFNVDNTFWSILDGNNDPIPVGVSNYVPEDGETVTFNFTQSTSHP